MIFSSNPDEGPTCAEDVPPTHVPYKISRDDLEVFFKSDCSDKLWDFKVHVDDILTDENGEQRSVCL